MTIRMSSLGGNDFGNERARYNDFNDTFDEIVRIVDIGNE